MKNMNVNLDDYSKYGKIKVMFQITKQNLNLMPLGPTQKDQKDWEQGQKTLQGG